MRKILILTSLLLFSCPLFSQVLGTTLAGWDFADGIPSGFVNGSSSGISHWEYRGPETTPSNAVSSRGSCAAGTVPLASQSQANGFVIFDSNYWDNPSLPCSAANFGTGPDPAPHNAWLITSPIDLTAATGAVITFQQQLKSFEATTKVQISINGGQSWTDVIVNSVLNTPAAEWKTGNVSGIAVGQPDVRFRFLFTGRYYHWCIDDIYVYQPNQNDVAINTATYTNFGNVGLGPLQDMEYDQYPKDMISPFSFRSRVANIGALTQTSVQLNVRILNQNDTQIYSQNSSSPTINPGAQTTLSITTPYTPSATLGDYRILYRVQQSQADQDLSNNRDTLDYTISQHTYARDEGPAENVFVPQPSFLNQRMELGNVFEIRKNGFQLHSITVAVGAGTSPGTVIKGYLYDEALDTLFAETVPYTVNLADINDLGEEKMISLPLTQPYQVYKDSLYCIMAGNLDASQPLRICRSGVAPPNTSFVLYPDVFGLFYLLTTPVVRMELFPVGSIAGCTDPAAMNYIPSATLSDGSCDYPGCTQELAANYNPNANFDDGSCQFPGCTNPIAENYDPSANFDDGSCIIRGCTDPEADNYNPEANTDDGSCVTEGCTDPVADNYNPDANTDDGSCIYIGCTDPDADNYDPTALTDDGTCIYFGCTDSEADNFDPEANTDDGSCIFLGCMDPVADNYDPQANTDDGTCIYVGCTDPEADNYDPTAITDDGTCLYIGCTDPEADNYDPQANLDDLSCVYTIAVISTEDMGGCAPYSIHVLNQTNVIEGSTCLFEISDGTVVEECVTDLYHTFLEPGEYYVTLTYTTDTGYSVAQVGPIMVHPQPLVPNLTWSPGSIVCSNCNGDTFSWFVNDELRPDLTTSSISTFLDGTFVNGTYQLLVTNGFGCQSVSPELTIVQPYFSVNPMSGCTPVEISLNDLTDPLPGMSCAYTADGVPVEWNGGAATVLLEEAGPIPILLTCSYNSVDYVTEISVDVLQTVIPDLSVDENNEILTCSNCSGYSSVWKIDGEVVAEDVTSVDILQSGNYEVSVSDESICGGSSSIDLTVGITEESGLKQLHVYPNPADHSTNVVSRYIGGLYSLTDLTGRIVLQVPCKSHSTELITKDLAPGVYMIHLTGSEAILSNRLVIRH